MKMFFLPFALVFFVNLFLLCQTNKDSLNLQDTATNRFALVIGNADYKSIGRLKNTANDAKAIARELKKVGFQVSLCINLSKQQMKDTIRAFREIISKIPDCVVLFYFGGHGTQVEGENYLIPVNTKIEKEMDIEYEAVSLKYILNHLTHSKPMLCFVFLDACRASKLNGMRKAGSYGLAAMQAPPGTVIVYSAAGDITDDYGDIFASAIIRYLTAENLSFWDFFKSVRNWVYKMTRKRQRVWSSSGVDFDFYFNKVNK